MLIFFQSLIVDLDRKNGIYQDELGLKTAVLCFINAALNCGAGQVRDKFRGHNHILIDFLSMMLICKYFKIMSIKYL